MALRLPHKGYGETSMLPNFKKSGAELNGASRPPVIPAQSFAPSRSERTISILGPDLTVEGDLISTGELRVDGDMQGDIRGVRVVIGETARHRRRRRRRCRYPRPRYGLRARAPRQPSIGESRGR